MGMLLSELPIRDRVAAGAAWLDMHGPADWELKVDPETLDVGSGLSCVLGQVYGHYYKSPRESRYEGDLLGAYLAVERGFNADEADLPALNAAWRKLIQDRR